MDFGLSPHEPVITSTVIKSGKEWYDVSLLIPHEPIRTALLTIIEGFKYKPHDPEKCK